MNLLKFLKQKTQTADEALRQMLTKAQYKVIQEAVSDRRQTLFEVARLLGTSENRLLEEIAKRLELPFLTKLPNFTLDVKAMGLSEKELKERAMTLLEHDGVVTGIVCVEPALINPLKSIYPNIPVYLSLWSIISEQITASISQSISTITIQNQKKDEKLKRLASQVIDLLLKDMKFDGKEGIIILSPNPQSLDLSYSVFNTPTKEVTTSGTILGKIVPHLLEHLMPNGELSREILWSTSFGEFFIKAEPTLVSREIKVVVKRIGEKSVPEEEDYLDKTDVIKKELPKILIIDDQEVLLQVMKKRLSTEFEVRTCKEPLEAIDLLHSENFIPDVIVSDVHMPRMDGTAFIDWIKKTKFKDIPVILFSSDDSDELNIELIEKGAEVFISKAMTYKVIVAHIKRITKKLNHQLQMH